MNIQQGDPENVTPVRPYIINGDTYYPLDGSSKCMKMERGCCGVEPFGTVQQTAKYDDTDPFSMKPNVKVDFSEVFQEPEGSEGFQFIWRYNKIIFSWTNRVIYSLLSGVLGPILAVVWGLVFAILNFAIVWALNPVTKVALQLLRIAEVIIRGAVRSALDPLFQAIGQMFTFLRGTFTLRAPDLKDFFKLSHPHESNA